MFIVLQVTLPFRADINHQNNCTVVVEGQGVVAQGSGANSYVQGLIPLTSGKHTWKVSNNIMRFIAVLHN